MSAQLQPGVSAGLKSADDAAMEAALRGADITVLRTALYQLTGDAELRSLKTSSGSQAAADRAAPPGLERAEDQEFVRRKAMDVLHRIRDGKLAIPRTPSLEQFGEL